MQNKKKLTNIEKVILFCTQDVS